jgi:hypothetical protein
MLLPVDVVDSGFARLRQWSANRLLRFLLRLLHLFRRQYVPFALSGRDPRQDRPVTLLLYPLVANVAAFSD